MGGHQFAALTQLIYAAKVWLKDGNAGERRRRLHHAQPRARQALLRLVLLAATHSHDALRVPRAACSAGAKGPAGRGGRADARVAARVVGALARVLRHAPGAAAAGLLAAGPAQPHLPQCAAPTCTAARPFVVHACTPVQPARVGSPTAATCRGEPRRPLHCSNTTLRLPHPCCPPHADLHSNRQWEHHGDNALRLLVMLLVTLPAFWQVGPCRHSCRRCRCPCPLPALRAAPPPARGPAASRRPCRRPLLPPPPDVCHAGHAARGPLLLPLSAPGRGHHGEPPGPAAALQPPACLRVQARQGEERAPGSQPHPAVAAWAGAFNRRRLHSSALPVLQLRSGGALCARVLASPGVRRPLANLYNGLLLAQ